MLTLTWATPAQAGQHPQIGRAAQTDHHPQNGRAAQPAAEVTASCTPAPHALELLVIDAVELAPDARDALRGAVTDILGPTGIDATFPALSAAPDTPRAAARLKVVLLGEDGARFGVPPDSMGANLVVPKRSAGTVFVFVPTVITAIRRFDRSAAVRPKLLGRATGRVVVHEVVHALAPTSPHAATGIMKAVPNLRDLLAPTARLDQRSTSAIVAALRGRACGR